MPSYPYPKLELKYCERCGGLWLRPAGHAEAYCPPCARGLADLPALPSSARSDTTVESCA